MKRTFILLIILTGIQVGFSQSAKPKLVVGIVVDQMRQDFVYRYWDNYSDRGFKRLIGQGFMLRNMHYNYAQTVTGAGHASIFTGTTPSYHGIIGNSWYDKFSGQIVNCVGDDSVRTVGAENARGHASAHRLLASTITDELKLASQGRSRIISISIKDRGAILPGGHMADGAFWFDAATGNFVSSTYYMDELPKWVENFNKKNYAEKYAKQRWDLLLPKSRYTASGPDDSPYEQVMRGKETPTFPYEMRDIMKEYSSYDVLNVTPFGNQILIDLAIASLRGEDLGQRDETDLLAISFSSPDYAGHSFGPNSMEVEDMYIRLDQQIGDLLDQLDELVGKGSYTLFLSADHGVIDNGSRLRDWNMPGMFSRTGSADELNTYLGKYLGGDKKYVLNIYGGQVFLDHDLLAGSELESATKLAARYMSEQDGVFEVYTAEQLKSSDYDGGGIKGKMVRGYNQTRSGDVLFTNYPDYALLDSSPKGTGHGSPFTFDTHVPLLLYGAGIVHGESSSPYTIADIAPTISILLNIRFPSASTGQPIVEALSK